MANTDGIIHSFQERRRLEAEITALGDTNSEAALVKAAQHLADAYAADLLLAVVLRHLGTPNGQVRGGLGHLCALLPTQETVTSLRGVAANRQKTAQERTTAALILDRYLGEPAPNALLADLAGSADVPYQSLLEAIAEARKNRHILLEYVTQMQEHTVDTAFMVLGLVDRLPAADQIELLRLIAQDSRPQVARAALDRLVSLASGEASTAALRALHTLQFALSPDPAAGVERSLRKLQFGGKRYQPPNAAGWRALISPTDAGGYLSVWLVREPTTDGAEDGILLGFVLNLHAGILQFSGTEGMERTHLPVVQPVGALVTVRTSSVQTMVLLEAPLAVGRWLVRKAFEAHWRQEQAAPLAGEYILYNDWVWQFEAPQLPAELEALWVRGGDTGNAPIDAAALIDAAAALAVTPAMEGWVRWSTAVWDGVQPSASVPQELPRSALVALLLRELGRMPDHANLLAAMAAGLRVQSLWFALAAEPQNAARAATLAAATARLPIGENPLLVILLERGLQKDRG